MPGSMVCQGRRKRIAVSPGPLGKDGACLELVSALGCGVPRSCLRAQGLKLLQKNPKFTVLELMRSRSKSFLKDDMNLQRV